MRLRQDVQHAKKGMLDAAPFQIAPLYLDSTALINYLFTKRLPRRFLSYHEQYIML